MDKTLQNPSKPLFLEGLGNFISHILFHVFQVLDIHDFTGDGHWSPKMQTAVADFLLGELT